MDFFTVPTLTFGVLYCFFVIGHDRRKILHFNVIPILFGLFSNCEKHGPTKNRTDSCYSTETRQEPRKAEGRLAMRTGLILDSRRTRQQVGLPAIRFERENKIQSLPRLGGLTIVMRWQRRFKNHFLMTNAFAYNPAEDGSCLLRASFAGRRISLQSRTEELAPNLKKPS
jgi:hypothetical protein